MALAILMCTCSGGSGPPADLDGVASEEDVDHDVASDREGALDGDLLRGGRGEGADAGASATRGGACLEVEPAALMNLGCHPLGAVASGELVVRACGPEAVVIEAMSFDSNTSPAFAVLGGGGLPRVITPGEEASFEVTYKPSSESSCQGAMALYDRGFLELRWKGASEGAVEGLNAWPIALSGYARNDMPLEVSLGPVPKVVEVGEGVNLWMETDCLLFDCVGDVLFRWSIDAPEGSAAPSTVLGPWLHLQTDVAGTWTVTAVVEDLLGEPAQGPWTVSFEVVPAADTDPERASWASAVPIDLEGVVFMEGYAFHRYHAHNEGVGKWYFHVSAPTPVYAPEDGVIPSPIRDWAKGPDVVVEGKSAVPDTRVLVDALAANPTADSARNSQRRWVYLHIWARADLADASDVSPVEVQAGELLGWTSNGFTALDLRLLDWTQPNGMPEVEALHELPWVRCPMEGFPDGSAAKAALLETWEALTWEPAVGAREDAEVQGVRAPRSQAELAPDSCSPFVVSDGLEGTLWGLWFHEDGPLPDGHPLGGWFHFPRGTVTLLPNVLLQEETYTIGYAGEDGLFSEMESYLPGVGDAWFESQDAVSLFLPEGVDETDTEGCFVLSQIGEEDALDALWVAFERSPSTEPTSLEELRLEATDASDLDGCLEESDANAESDLLRRYPPPP